MMVVSEQSATALPVDRTARHSCTPSFTVLLVPRLIDVDRVVDADAQT